MMYVEQGSLFRMLVDKNILGVSVSQVETRAQRFSNVLYISICEGRCCCYRCCWTTAVYGTGALDIQRNKCGLP